MNLKNIIFDFDGTLADTRQCSILATQEAFSQFGLKKPSEQDIAYYMGVPIEISFKKMADAELPDELFQRLLVTFRKAYKELENDYIAAFPGIPEVLEKLLQQGKQIFVVSSKKSDVLLRNLKTLQIDEMFRDVIGADKVSHYKPHPEGILQLQERYSFQSEETVMIGDTIFDVQMAKAAGVYSCGVTWASHEKEILIKENPTFLVEETRQLAVLESLGMKNKI